MYFIVEGSVHVIAADKITVVKTLSQGDYFGEIAILFPSKRVAYV
jgi:CRP-like cAMP-binding protein